MLNSARRAMRLHVPTIVAAVILGMTGLLAGCGGGSEEVPKGDEAASPVHGGVLRVPSASFGALDPAKIATTAGAVLAHNVFEGLVEADAQLQIHPLLATDWRVSADGKEWVFTLQEGVKFHNGDTFDSGDVLFTFARLRDPDVGSATAPLFENVKSIKAPDATHVVFNLAEPNPEFTKDLADYHVVMVSETVKDPGKDFVGTGPFVFESLAAEDRIVLAKNPDYWMKDDTGRQLPYLEGVEILLSPDTTAHIEALRGGQLDLVYGVSPVLAQTLEKDNSLRLLKFTANTFYTLNMRCDRGPSADKRVRQAISLGMDREALLKAGSLGFGLVGNGTPVGPLYGDYSLDQQPEHDPARAKELLVDAGYEDGLDIKLTVMNWGPLPAAATTFKDQMKAIGVNVDLQMVPVDVYYADKGENSWLETDFGITDWLTRAVPIAYFQLSLTSDGGWNSSHWSNEEFDAVVTDIAREMDEERRVELYHRAQEILLEEVPTAVFYFDEGLIGMAQNVQGFEMVLPEFATSFRGTYFGD